MEILEKKVSHILCGKTVEIQKKSENVGRSNFSHEKIIEEFFICGDKEFFKARLGVQGVLYYHGYHFPDGIFTYRTTMFGIKSISERWCFVFQTALKYETNNPTLAYTIALKRIGWTPPPIIFRMCNESGNLSNVLYGNMLRPRNDYEIIFNYAPPWEQEMKQKTYPSYVFPDAIVRKDKSKSISGYSSSLSDNISGMSEGFRYVRNKKGKILENCFVYNDLYYRGRLPGYLFQISTSL